MSVRTSRAFIIVALLIAAAAVSWYWATHRPMGTSGRITIYYTKLDGGSEIPWSVSMRPQQPGESGAEPGTTRFFMRQRKRLPGLRATSRRCAFRPDTSVITASVNDSTALVDLS